MSLDRKGAVVAIVFFAAFAAIGCSKGGAPAVSEKAPVLAVESAKPAESKPAEVKQVESLPPQPRDAKLAAIQFLDMLGSGNEKAVELVAVSFRKQLSGLLFFPEDKQLGYSNSDASKYLQKQFNMASAARIRSESQAPSGREVVFRGDLEGKDPMTFALRISLINGKWLVSRFTTANTLQAAVPTNASDPELAWARESAVDYLQSWLGGERENYTVPLAMMTEEMKSKLPSPTVHDTGLTYAKKDVRNWLNTQREGVAGYSISSQSMDGAMAVFQGELTTKEKHRPFRLALRQDGGEWKIDACDLKQ
jgi:hypothetical protein